MVWSGYYAQFVKTAIVKYLFIHREYASDTPEKLSAKTSINEAIIALSFHQHNEVHPTGDPRRDLITVMKGHHV